MHREERLESWDSVLDEPITFVWGDETIHQKHASVDADTAVRTTAATTTAPITTVVPVAATSASAAAGGTTTATASAAIASVGAPVCDIATAENFIIYTCGTAATVTITSSTTTAATFTCHRTR
jgi:hypothetical protein